ncbi:MAG: hypothetical protein MJB12_08675 [Firmicutes bacterium]|nr:hypothetical protein [Bacillota bacterium]
MSVHFKNTVKVASVYAGTILGAGFASGQEILQFFIVYGEESIYGIILSALLFALIGAGVLNKIYRHNICSYDQYVFPLIGKKMGRFVEILVCLFMLSSFCVMTAGSGAIFYEEMGLSKRLGIIVMVLLCLIVFLNDIKGVVLVNSILAPMMSAGIIILGCYILIVRDCGVLSMMHLAKQAVYNWFSSSLVYVSYNTLTIVVIMTALSPILTKRSVAVMGGLIGGMSLGIVAGILWMVMMLFYSDIISYELPLLQIMISQGRAAELIYVCILYSAMFTTAVASGYGFLNRITTRFKVNKNICTIGFCLLAIPFAEMGFSNLVKNVYALFGYLGLFMVVVIIVDGVKEMIRKNASIL